MTDVKVDDEYFGYINGDYDVSLSDEGKIVIKNTSSEGLMSECDNPKILCVFINALKTCDDATVDKLLSCKELRYQKIGDYYVFYHIVERITPSQKFKGSNNHYYSDNIIYCSRIQ